MNCALANVRVNEIYSPISPSYGRCPITLAIKVLTPKVGTTIAINTYHPLLKSNVRVTYASFHTHNRDIPRRENTISKLIFSTYVYP